MFKLGANVQNCEPLRPLALPVGRTEMRTSIIYHFHKSAFISLPVDSNLEKIRRKSGKSENDTLTLSRKLLYRPVFIIV